MEEPMQRPDLIQESESQAAKAAIDAPVALAIVELGILIILAPSSIPGLTPPM